MFYKKKSREILDTPDIFIYDIVWQLKKNQSIKQRNKQTNKQQQQQATPPGEVPVQFQSNMVILIPNLVALIFREI